MKKFTVCFISVLSVLLLVCGSALSGCITLEIGGDSIDYYRLVQKDSESGFKVYNYDYNYYDSFYLDFISVEIDPVNGTYTVCKSEDDTTEIENCEVVSCGTNSGKDDIYTADGYEELYNSLNAEGSVIDCLGWSDGDTVTGICNSYNTSGKITIASGNQNRVDKINRLIVFTYTIASGEFNIIYSLDGAVASAYSGGTLIYLKDNCFYACDISTGGEKLLTKNYAITRKANKNTNTINRVYFDNDYAYFELRCSTSDGWDYYRYLYNFESGEFMELVEA